MLLMDQGKTYLVPKQHKIRLHTTGKQNYYITKTSPRNTVPKASLKNITINYQLPVNYTALPMLTQQVEHLQSSMPTSPDPEIHEILQKYTTVFEGHGNPKITRFNFMLTKMSNSLSTPSTDNHTIFPRKFPKN